MNWRIVFIIAAITTCFGYYMGRTFNPKIETKIEEKEVIKKDIVTVVKEVVKTDGTKETTTTIVDHSKEKKDTQVSITKPLPPPNNKLTAQVHTTTFREVDSYTLSYERRILPSVWAGVNYNTKQVYGLSVGFEF